MIQTPKRPRSSSVAALILITLLGFGGVLTVASPAQGAFANEQLYACTTGTDFSNGRSLRAEFIFDPGVCGRITGDRFTQEPLFSYYRSVGFDANFLDWAPIVQRSDISDRRWGGCPTDHGPGTVCPGGPSNVGFRFPISADFSGPATVKTWNDGFIGVVCGNFSQTGGRNGPIPSIAGTKYDDRNANGVRDPGEPGLGGVLIRLFRNGIQAATTTTAADGSYSFALDADSNPNIGPGTYTLSEDVPNGYHQTAAPGAVVVNSAIGPQTFGGNDFGNAKAQPSISTVPSGATHVGAAIFDRATLSGGNNPAGAVNFTLYAPGDTSCANPVATATGTLNAGSAVSSNLVAEQPGIYRWVASYPGDGSNYGATSPCGSETVQLYPPITATPVSTTGVEGAPLNATLANFTDPDPAGTPAEYEATIDWGDGTPPTAGTILQPGGPGTEFSVTGTHVYGEEGLYGPSVTITDVGDAFNTATTHSTATVGDAVLSAAGLRPTSPQGFNGPVATFTDANVGSTTADFTAMIDWGDGSSSSTGRVSGSDGSFIVSGEHTYRGTGFFTVTVRIVDDGGSTATATSTILIYGTAAGGSFVIGDRSATSGKPVTFWGAQWWKLNALSAGAGPASFKGFEDTPIMASCGTSWTTDPGNSTPPPSGPLPAYMAVIVSSSIDQAGSTIAGDTVHEVVVKTDAGYAPNPGHAGTGTVIATIC